MEVSNSSDTEDLAGQEMEVQLRIQMDKILLDNDCLRKELAHQESAHNHLQRAVDGATQEANDNLQKLEETHAEYQRRIQQVERESHDQNQQNDQELRTYDSKVRELKQLLNIRETEFADQQAEAHQAIHRRESELEHRQTEVQQAQQILDQREAEIAQIQQDEPFHLNSKL